MRSLSTIGMRTLLASTNSVSWYCDTIFGVISVICTTFTTPICAFTSELQYCSAKL